ncbi:MAG TPA: hypothetical protein VFF16_10365 [Telluria sp.]|nr:hypothetical protein [Telluria sp.]
MAVLIVGILFLVMGLFAGAVLVLAPLGMAHLEPNAVLWLLFPFFTLVGYGLCAANARDSIRPLTLGASWTLLVLAVAAAIAILLDATGVRAANGTLSLWFVLGVAGLAGTMGAAAFARRR